MSCKKILKLSEHAINQIAAGEVIENPASIVKELVENALDAGALQIRIETISGGLNKIVVADDGIGMDKEDALFCFERYATSKIRDLEDLWSVTTMGFRGEALAAIAAVSKIILTTNTDKGVGTQVEIEGGKLVKVQVAARSKGTTIEVKDLFYNVPARRKFQKSPAQCSGEIGKLIGQMSLARQDVSFKWLEGGKEAFYVSHQHSFLDRVAYIYGDSFLEGSHQVDVAIAEIHVTGVLGSFHNTRPSRVLQFQCVNQRVVSLPLLSYAVKDAYGARIEQNRYPIFALCAQIPSSYLDVNVHPQKKEIRLKEEKWLKQTLQEMILSTLSQKEKPVQIPFSIEAPKEHRDFPDQIEQPVYVQDDFYIPQSRVEIIGFYESFFWILGSSTAFLKWQIPSTGIWIVDVRGANSRILLDHSKRRDVTSQKLAFGFSIHIPFDFQVEMSDLKEMGFSLIQRDKNTFFVEAIPAKFSEEIAEKFLLEYLEKGNDPQAIERSLHLIASSKVRSLQEAHIIWQELIKSESPIYCPLGKRIIAHLDKQKIEELFRE